MPWWLPESSRHWRLSLLESCYTHHSSSAEYKHNNLVNSNLGRTLLTFSYNSNTFLAQQLLICHSSKKWLISSFFLQMPHLKLLHKSFNNCYHFSNHYTCTWELTPACCLLYRVVPVKVYDRPIQPLQGEGLSKPSREPLLLYMWYTSQLLWLLPIQQYQ